MMREEYNWIDKSFVAFKINKAFVMARLQGNDEDPPPSTFTLSLTFSKWFIALAFEYPHCKDFMEQDLYDWLTKHYRAISQAEDPRSTVASNLTADDSDDVEMEDAGPSSSSTAAPSASKVAKSVTDEGTKTAGSSKSAKKPAASKKAPAPVDTNQWSNEMEAFKSITQTCEKMVLTGSKGKGSNGETATWNDMDSNSDKRKAVLKRIPETCMLLTTASHNLAVTHALLSKKAKYPKKFSFAKYNFSRAAMTSFQYVQPAANKKSQSGHIGADEDPRLTGPSDRILCGVPNQQVADQIRAYGRFIQGQIEEKKSINYEFGMNQPFEAERTHSWIAGCHRKRGAHSDEVQRFRSQSHFSQLGYYITSEAPQEVHDQIQTYIESGYLSNLPTSPRVCRKTPGETIVAPSNPRKRKASVARGNAAPAPGTAAAPRAKRTKRQSKQPAMVRASLKNASIKSTNTSAATTIDLDSIHVNYASPNPTVVDQQEASSTTPAAKRPRGKHMHQGKPVSAAQVQQMTHSVRAETNIRTNPHPEGYIPTDGSDDEHETGPTEVGAGGEEDERSGEEVLVEDANSESDGVGEVVSRKVVGASITVIGGGKERRGGSDSEDDSSESGSDHNGANDGEGDSVTESVEDGGADGDEVDDTSVR